MIKINNKNINDILKEKDSIEKYCKLMDVLYVPFVIRNDLEDSLVTKTHFIEAMTLFLRMNSSSLFDDTKPSDKLIERYKKNMDVVQGNISRLEFLEDDGEHEEYIKKHFISIQKELYLYARVLYCDECRVDDFNRYLENLIVKGVQALDSYQGKNILTNSKLFALYSCCCVMSITNVLKNDTVFEFFNEDNSKYVFNHSEGIIQAFRALIESGMNPFK